METQLPANVLTCTQCGGELHPDEGQIFVTCPFCSSTVYIDKSRVVFHWYVAPTLDASQAQAALRRWMTGSQTVKDLDEKSQIGAPGFEYFPLWVFKLRGLNPSLSEPLSARETDRLNQNTLRAVEYIILQDDYRKVMAQGAAAP